MKYKNLKLPTIPSGEEIEIFVNNSFNGLHIYREENVINCNERLLEIIISEGWIEEAKPREFEIELYKDGCFGLKTIRGDILKGIINSLQTDPVEIIKVREVIDE